MVGGGAVRAEIDVTIYNRTGEDWILEVCDGGLLLAGLPGEPVEPMFDDSDPGGVYRMTFSGLRDALSGEPLDAALGVSNPFELVPEPWRP